MSGITNRHKKEVKRILEHYLSSIQNTISKSGSIQYFKQLKNTCSVSYYRKQMYQILKFLTYLGFDWTKEIQLPSDPIYHAKRVSSEDIQQLISFFDNHKYFLQIKSLILLGSCTGMRAEEIYQLNSNDIDLDKRIVYINHNPLNHQTTKTKQNRVTFFNIQTKVVLSNYLVFFSDNKMLDRLYSQSHLKRIFSNAPMQVKDLRKFFSQEWDRRGGPTSIKKILMGHSLKGDVDLCHYNAQSVEDLKKIYDRVMCDE